MDRVTTFDSPEEAALAGWPEAARARVISVEVRGNRAEVVVTTDPDYPYWVYSQRSGEGWQVTLGSNGPCDGWDDPAKIQWGA